MKKIPVWVWYIVVGGVAYMAFRYFKKGVGVVTQPVSNVIADVITGTENIFNPPIVPVGSVILPNGTPIPVAQLTPRVDAAGRTLIVYNGRTYSLQPHDANGNWPAVLLS